MADFIWSGTLTFGLVTLPVHLLPAVSENRTSLTLLHEKDAAPLERKMVCPAHDEVVEPGEQVKGFEIEDGEYVVVTNEELESLAPERSRAIEIEEFVELEAMDPLYFDRPYYLTPGEGAERPYRLLVRALGETGKAGLARFVLRDREHWVGVWAVEGVLGLTTLHYRRQRVSPEGLAPEKARVSPEALDELVEGIEESTVDFDAASYRDENELRLLELIRNKGKEEGVENAPRAKGNKKPSPERLAKRVSREIEKTKAEG